MDALSPVSLLLLANSDMPPLRLPFTLTLLAALVGTAIWTNTHRGAIGEDDLRDYGYAPRHLLGFEWRRIFSSIFMTVGGWRFYASLLATAVFVGRLEWIYGATRTAVFFFAIHVATLLIESAAIIAPLRFFRHPLGNALHLTHDVGPSAGYYGCFGAVLSLSGFSAPFIGIVALYLALRIVRSLFFVGKNEPDLSADIAHLIAFTLGLAWGSVGQA
ncbi:rhomboid family intramembrane serine protease [Blastopirellula sp. JC732]|uniref:Rhomboid family intramembrane serine protease n=1 Tax=Blastopirellula sediminis TaxID=2894196 RepID=A0A9X1SHH5_9BACT|nr:rhomboid family intramembrane serine protease [Blastopirellula sediminis]MCC9607983.1 rhomboid family intramembrane serine protease [Blastopirellula sediminis]MCC9627224.1 rhomboid family intramembrane serine protease [Blastopirellula sediminis]